MRFYVVRLWLVGLLWLGAGCSSSRWLAVRVQATDGRPLANATVAAVCEPRGSAARLTGSDGIAWLDIRNYEPKACMVTAVRTSYQTAEVRTEQVCRQRNPCPPLDLRLEAE